MQGISNLSRHVNSKGFRAHAAKFRQCIFRPLAASRVVRTLDGAADVLHTVLDVRSSLHTVRGSPAGLIHTVEHETTKVEGGQYRLRDGAKNSQPQGSNAYPRCK